MQFHESDAVEILNADGRGAVVLLCEHASHFIPGALNGLGLAKCDQTAHIAWDPGAEAVSLILSDALDAPYIAGRTSRLVYDCNRPPDSPGAMPMRSETTDIPGNAALTEPDRQARVEGVYRPFCKAVETLLATRASRGQPTVLVTMHSFTPVYFGTPRTVEIGILHDTDSTLADAMLSRAADLPRQVRRNDPYGPADGVTHSLQLHGIAQGLPNVMIEIRNDLIRDSAGQAQLAQEVLGLLQPALADLNVGAADA
ncbi:MAG: N-formylglutamate amidohydrolase [Roseovarius sp.]